MAPPTTTSPQLKHVWRGHSCARNAGRHQPPNRASIDGSFGLAEGWLSRAAVPTFDPVAGFARLLLIKLSNSFHREFPGFPTPPQKQPNRYSCHYHS